MFEELGKFGAVRRWNFLTPEMGAALEDLGYGAIWVAGSPDGDLAAIEAILAATKNITVVTGIVNIWKDEPQTVAASFHRIEARYPGRFVLGIGVGHPEAISDYTRPYSSLVKYLDELDAAAVPIERRLLAALGDKVMALARDRSIGANPYLVTPEHTRHARQILGPDKLLATTHNVIVESDPEVARALARPSVTPYLERVNYTNSLRANGFTDEDFIGSGSDRLLDAVFAHGDPASIAVQLHAHLDAGADHVPVMVYTDAGADPMPAFTAMAQALFR
jgi:probable F420-dependent oxidoreductase